ncbi:MAG TPA: type I methionyl aminopeptidase [Longimicrobiaceae bacterium]
MSIENEQDRLGMKRVGRVVRLTLDALEKAVRPGISTGELDAIARQLFAEHGARSAPAEEYGFPGTVLLSVNDEAVHGIPGERRLAPGDLVKLDVTAALGGYVADAARTVVVGVGSPVAHGLQEAARAAFARALLVARAGNRINEIGRAVEAEVRARGFHVIPGLEGHGTGRRIHEAPTVSNQYDPRQRERLREGMVLTIEPIISAGKALPAESDDGWTIRTSDGSLAAHHEHTLIITRGLPVVLTAA